jgi:hypothetical protein
LTELSYKQKSVAAAAVQHTAVTLLGGAAVTTELMCLVAEAQMCLGVAVKLLITD